MEAYLNLEFFLVLASVIFIICLPKIIIKLSRKSKVGLVVALVLSGIVIISLVVYFTATYNARYSLEGKNYIYGRIISIKDSSTFVINSTKGTYQDGSVGYITVKIDKDTAVYSKNLLENIKTVDIDDFVTVVCKNDEMDKKTVKAVRVIKDH